MKKFNILFILPFVILTSCGEKKITKSYVEYIFPIEYESLVEKYKLDDTYSIYYSWSRERYEKTMDKDKNYSIINDIFENSIWYNGFRNLASTKDEILYINSINRFSLKFSKSLASSEYFVDCYSISFFDYDAHEYYLITFKDYNLYNSMWQYFNYLKYYLTGEIEGENIISNGYKH